MRPPEHIQEADCVRQDETYRQHLKHHRPGVNTALLRASRQVHAEAGGVLLDCNTLIAQLRVPELPTLPTNLTLPPHLLSSVQHLFVISAEQCKRTLYGHDQSVVRTLFASIAALTRLRIAIIYRGAWGPPGKRNSGHRRFIEAVMDGAPHGFELIFGPHFEPERSALAAWHLHRNHVDDVDDQEGWLCDAPEDLVHQDFEEAMQGRQMASM